MTIIRVEQVIGIQAEIGSQLDDLNLAGSLRYERTFTSADLTGAGLLIVTHMLGVIPGSVTVLDHVLEPAFASQITNLSTSILSLDLADFQPIQGVWRVIIGG